MAWNMGRGIFALPLFYSQGGFTLSDAFTIASWPVDTTVELCCVDWDNAYKDVVRFASPAARDAYFEGLESSSIVLDHLTYCKPGEPVKINIPFNACYNYNYLVVTNPQLPVPGDITPPKLYYFVTGVAFSAPNTSVLTLALDVFQTYLFNADGTNGFELGYSFLERGHWPMKLAADETTWSATGYPTVSADTKKKYLNYPEGLEVGNDYTIGYKEYKDLAYVVEHSSDLPYSLDWSIIIMSTTDLTADWGTVSSPNLDTATGFEGDGLSGGCNIYVMSYTMFGSFMREVSKAPWVSSGIINISAFPSVFLKLGNMVQLGTTWAYKLVNSSHGSIFYETLTTVNDGFSDAFAEVATNAKRFTKLYTYPYSYLQISNRSGQTLNLKPELLKTDKLTLRSYCNAVPGNMRVGLAVSQYGTGTADTDESYTYGTLVKEDNTGHSRLGYNIDCSIWFDNFPQLSIVNDGYLMYLAGTTNSREYAYNAASWGYQKSNAATNLMIEQTKLQMETNQANRDVANMLGVANIGYGAVAGGLGGALAGGGVGAVAGAIGGAAMQGLNLYGSNLQFANNQAQVTRSAGMNAQYQQFANKGDYQNSIAAINATVQDAALTQPSIVGNNGGNGFNLANGLMGLDIRWMVPQPKFVNTLCSYWGKYGYAYHEYVTPPADLDCGNTFSYWKMQDVYLTSAKADEGAKNVLRGIFEKGVTVWKNPTQIGKINPMDNYCI